MSVLARAAILVALAGAGASAPARAHHDHPQEHARKVVQVVFVLDTTGSMTPLIEGAKRKIWSIATAIVDENPGAEVQMGLVAYRDVGDEYVTRAFPLTTDLQGLYGELLGLKARGGGDWPESVNAALFLAVTQSNWDTGAGTDRIVFLVGDAPPHMDYPQDRPYAESLEYARKRGLAVNAVQAGAARDTERVWRTIAQLGNGRYIPIPQDGGQVLVVDTPFDREIIELQIEINRTVVPYGSPQQQGAVRRKAEGTRTAPAGVATDMAGYVSKAGKGRAAVTGEGDLVADVAAGRDLAGVQEEDLPEEFRRLTAAERQAALDARRQLRERLAARMGDLVRKRDAVLARAAAASPAKPDSFDAAVKDTLRGQIKR
jgi:uncharacterized protein (DUF433 family)